ncbi:MAG: amidohydrolase family protein [Thermoanaerobaculia bacterium]
MTMSRSAVLRVLWGLSLSAAFLQMPARPAFAGSFVIDDVTVIDATGKPAQGHMRVTVEGNRIIGVGPAAGQALPAGAVRIDGAGKFLIPGLWDMHVHLVDIDEPAIPILPYYGITSVRDMGGDLAKVQGWRTQIEKGELVGPRIKACGPMLEGKWDARFGQRTDHVVVANPEEARATVNRLADQGADCIKMRTYASPETYFALAATAKARHLPFVGHAPWGVEPIDASNAGQASFEHAYYPWPWADLPAEKRLAIEETFRKNSSLVDPTLIAWESFRFPEAVIAAVVNDVAAKTDPRQRYISAALRRNWISGLADMREQGPGTPGWGKAIDQVYEQVAEMHDHGVGILAGTDSGATMVYPGASLHQELKLLVAKCRFTPMDAILTATIVPAKQFHMEDRLGTIESGKLADLVLLAEDPLQDIANIQQIAGVMLNGKWMDRAALDALATGVERRVAAESQK